MILPPRARRRSPRTRAHILLRLSRHASDAWGWNDAFEGVQVFGGTGSGKTSGSGAALAHAYLSAGWGGLVHTAKPDEPDLWRRYAAATGRSDDLIFFGPGHPWRFNFLRYESERPGAGGGNTENLVRLFLTLLEASEPAAGAKSDQFWERAVRQLLGNAIDLLILAAEPLSMGAIHRLLASVPYAPEQLADPAWQQSAFCLHALDAATRRHPSHPDLPLVEQFFLRDMPASDPRTRANISQTFTSMADAFSRGTLRDLFGAELSLVPEFSHVGKIIVLDMPTKEHGYIGRIAQVLFKYLWQQAVERRNLPQHPRPCFLWADEAQEFVVKHDAEFQATARSARVATVYLTQSLSAYHARLGGGPQAEAQTAALLANLGAKVFHAQSDPVTNEWAERLINKAWRYRGNTNVSESNEADRRRPTVSSGVNPSLESQILPSDFLQLRTGGPANNGLVDALVFHNGRTFAAGGKPYLKVTFRQR